MYSIRNCLSAPNSDCTGIDSDLNIDFDGIGGESALCLSQIKSPPTLNPRERMIVYFQMPSPSSITSLNIGESFIVNVYTSSTAIPHSVIIQTA